jgi:wyosine [tRNA(Phe)-imidazoG37] synthetase (radical SAM superfamily)
MKYKYIFGPVPSRRLNISLGVDLVPHKVCSYNCIYCECGKTTNLTTERKEYVPTKVVLEELNDYLNRYPKPDYVTFSGSGEPTLHKDVGKIISFIKSEYPDIKIAILTNGSLFNDSNVRREILEADVILPSLDSAIEETFKRIDRPYSKLRIKSIIDGMIEFRKEYKGQIWLEVFIIEGINSDKVNLNELKRAIIEIKPDKIQLNTLDRPGTENWVKSVSQKILEDIVEYWNLDNVEIISKYKRREVKSYRDDVENAIIETIRRRPCTIEDLQGILSLHINELNKYIDVLENEGKIAAKIENRGIFYYNQSNFK